MDDPFSSELLDRYLAGEATPEERAVVDAWLAADPRRESVLAHLVRRLDEPAMRVDVDAAWSRFAAEQRIESPTRPHTRTFISPRVWQVAAAILLLAGAYLLSPMLHRHSQNPPMREAVAANGQRTTVTLDDGTRISLNGGSRIRYAAVHTGDRDVYLDGEAYFDVRHDPSRRFRVHAGSAVIQDIGTQFTVGAYASSEVDVAVSEGSVSLARESASATAVQLRAGDVGVLTDSGSPSVSHPASLDVYTGWTNGTLVLDGYSLARAAAAIERWYDVKIVIGDSSSAKRPVFARFHGQTADQAIRALALAVDMTVSHDRRTYTLAPRTR